MPGKPRGMASTASYLSDEAHRCIDEIEGSLRDRAAAGRWVVEGEATAGKSAVLRQLQTRLQQPRRPVVHLAPPPRSLDAGPCAMVSLAGQLYDAQPEGKDLEALLGQKTLDGYFNLVSDWLRGCQGDLVLLLDEPEAWSSAEAGKDRAFLEQTQRVLTFLGHIDCSQVLTGRTPAQFPWQRQQRRRLKLAGRNRQFLRDPDAWGELRDSAARLLLRDAPFDNYSPLEIRLLVGVEFVDPARIGELLEPGTDRNTLTNAFKEVVQKSPAHRRLLACWNLISKCRGPISEPMLRRLEARHQIQGPTLALLRHCLLYQEPGPKWVLHGTLQSGHWGIEPAATHSWLAGEYLLEAKEGGTQASILQADAEAYHHAVQSGDSQLWDSCRCFFVEQLNLWGRRLSKVDQNYEGATRVFERALQWDGEDSYANHYLAYNLDVQARESERVETHYRKAVLLQPEHPWLHSRLVNFLLAFARNREARDAWDKTQELSAFHSTGPVYRDLHFWVLRMLLHRGQLDFAKAVLDCIPPEMLLQFPELKQLRDQYESQYLAQTHGALVPGPVLTDGWWSRGPFRLKRHLSSGHQLRTWCAARVEATGSGSIHLKMASIELGQVSSPDLHWAEVEKETLAEWLLDSEELEAGSFLEIGYYYRSASGTENEQVRAYVHQPDTHPMLDLPRLQPDPDRYLRRALR